MIIKCIVEGFSEIEKTKAAICSFRALLELFTAQSNCDLHGHLDLKLCQFSRNKFSMMKIYAGMWSAVVGPNQYSH